MKMTDRGIRQLMKSEGFRQHAYNDSAGHLTIGVGHMLSQTELDSGFVEIGEVPVKWDEGLTTSQVEDLLEQDLSIFESAVSDMIDVKLCPHQFDALVHFAFNVGVGAFSNSTLLKRVNDMQFDDVPYQFLRWKYAGGKASRGIINRRKTEIKMWKGGKYGFI